MSFWKLHLKSTWLKGSQVSVFGTTLFVVRPISQVECSYGHSPKTPQIIYKNASRVFFFFLTSAVLWCVASGLLCSFVCLVWVRCLEFSGGQPLILCVSRDLPNLRHMLGISSASADTWCHASLHFSGSCFSFSFFHLNSLKNAHKNMPACSRWIKVLFGKNTFEKTNTVASPMVAFSISFSILGHFPQKWLFCPHRMETLYYLQIILMILWFLQPKLIMKHACDDTFAKLC